MSNLENIKSFLKRAHIDSLLTGTKTETVRDGKLKFRVTIQNSESETIRICSFCILVKTDLQNSFVDINSLAELNNEYQSIENEFISFFTDQGYSFQYSPSVDKTKNRYDLVLYDSFVLAK